MAAGVKHFSWSSSVRQFPFLFLCFSSLPSAVLFFPLPIQLLTFIPTCGKEYWFATGDQAELNHANVYHANVYHVDPAWAGAMTVDGVVGRTIESRVSGLRAMPKMEWTKRAVCCGRADRVGSVMWQSGPSGQCDAAEWTEQTGTIPGAATERTLDRDWHVVALQPLALGPTDMDWNF
eukprot:g35851.t1